MRFIDEVKITVVGGNGGNGCVAFRREAHVPRGGPSGGDGGRGGDVVFVADPGLSTLLDLRYQKHYRGEKGVGGQGSQKHGRRGQSRLVSVPCGTLFYDNDSGELLGDLVEPGQELVVAQGGRGGAGNTRFASSTNRAPRTALPGEPGEQRILRVELKVLAEVGLVGLPNAGKSTFITKVSAARPKIADYPFTTLIPNLGMVRLPGDRSIVIADIPGLVAGAHQGTGLGHRFLRHIERTKVLVFLVDDRHELDGTEGTPLGDLEILQAELQAHDSALMQRQAIVALNKTDLLSAQRIDEVSGTLAEHVFPISAATGDGLDALLEAVWRVLHESDQASEHS